MSVRKLLAYSRISYNWKVKKRTVLPYVPEDISIELTNVCNFSCQYCPQSDPEHFDLVGRSSLEPAQADELLTKLRQGGVRTDVIHWTLDGEPFINRQLDEICRVAVRRGFKKFIFSTNGYFLSADRLAALPTNDGAEYTLCVDYCGDAEYFEKIRGTPGSWARIKTHIENALGSDALGHIRFRLTDIASYSVADREELDRRYAELRSVFPTSDRLQIRSRIFHNMTGFLDGIKERKQAENPDGYNLCPYPWSSLVVASNGDVVACCRDLRHKTVVGNLLQEDLQSIWNGEQYQALRRALVEERPDDVVACRGCDLPYDQEKFSVGHIARTAINRLGIFK